MKKSQPVSTLLKAYNQKNFKSANKIKFTGLDGKDVYNITAPFSFKRTTYILGRVEPREEETTTKVMFFKRTKNARAWQPDTKCPIFDLQDPFLTKVGETIVFGGVETMQRTIKKIGIGYRTVFYKGKDIYNLRKFAHGPWGMKGIRLIELPNKKILVFTRPQGKKGRKGKIGCMLINSLKQLKSRALSRADLLSNQFAHGEWGGVNDAHLLKDGKIGVLAHIAKRTRDKKQHYYPVVFSIDLETGSLSKMKIIAKRSSLPAGDTKRTRQYDIIYPGGLMRLPGGKAKLYAGVSDAESYEITITDPFLKYEQPEYFEESKEDLLEMEKQLALLAQMEKLYSDGVVTNR